MIRRNPSDIKVNINFRYKKKSENKESNENLSKITSALNIYGNSS